MFAGKGEKLKPGRPCKQFRAVSALVSPGTVCCTGRQSLRSFAVERGLAFQLNNFPGKISELPKLAVLNAPFFAS